MKTREFIAMLQEADPTGESYLRFPFGHAISCIGKPGWYDGPYDYIDDKGNWVVDVKLNKVDVYMIDLESWLDDLMDENDSWDYIRSKIDYRAGEVRETQFINRVKRIYEALILDRNGDNG